MIEATNVTYYESRDPAMRVDVLEGFDFEQRQMETMAYASRFFASVRIASLAFSLIM